MGDVRKLREAVERLTGGRPMRRVGYAFTDLVTGESVYYWTDRLGRDWMATGAWSRFRIPTCIPATILRALEGGAE